jgi:O-antigen ligase
MSPAPKAESLKLSHIFALAFGFFLGLCIWKFGNPVILDNKIVTPNTFSDFLNDAWPLHWANWIFLPLAIVGAILTLTGKISLPKNKWLWILPLAWLGWQFVSATQTVDANLTNAVLWQFSGCVVCCFLGALIFSNRAAQNYLFIGILIAFTFCLIRAVDQKLFEFPLNYQALAEGQRAGWTNYPAETVVEMKQENIIVTTNGVDAANPVILEKFQKGRVAGTLVYPNALAGLILLVWPVSLALLFGGMKRLKRPIRLAAIGVTIFLGAAAFFWTGSKLGWLIGICVAGLFLLRLDFSAKTKIIAVAAVLIFGLVVFGVRFHGYFSKGATSVGARFDYWRAAVQTTLAKPFFGSGPGTFQRPYAQLKSPQSEMARLTHNDFLEQFSDSGILGGIFYAAWIFLALASVGRKLWREDDNIAFAMFAGLLAWFLQGLGEFSLYIPALAWTAFTLLGSLIGRGRIEFDKKSCAR